MLDCRSRVGFAEEVEGIRLSEGQDLGSKP